MSYRVTCPLFIVPLSVLGVSMEVSAVDVHYLSDHGAGLIVYDTMGWGHLGMNTAAIPSGGEGAPLRIGETEYERGLGHHADGEIFIALDGRCERFQAEVGVQHQGGEKGSVVFEVYADDERLFQSPVMSDSDPARPIDVSVSGCRELRLVARDGGDGNQHDMANWVDPRVTRSESPGVDKAVTLDVAPFARVVTSDPNRKDGARAKRTEAYRAEDVFLSSRVSADSQGHYKVPRTADGRGCIGLEWPEDRMIRHVRIHFEDAASVPDPESVVLEYWHGLSAWQGQFDPVATKIEREGNALLARLDSVSAPHAYRGTQKIRWIFPAGDEPMVVDRMSARTITPLTRAHLRVEPAQPKPGQTGAIDIYNGGFVSLALEEAPRRQSWDLSKPIDFWLEVSRARPWKTDRTVMRFTLPDAAFGVAVEDVLERGEVWIPHAGVFVTQAEKSINLDAHREQAADRKTVLERVRARPDQTFEQAWKAVHNAVQNNGPMMLSLACDNRKFVVERDGVIAFEPYESSDQKIPSVSNFSCRLKPTFGTGASKAFQRELHGGWLPAPTSTLDEEGMLYRQRTFVVPLDGNALPGTAGWLHQRAACVAEHTIQSTRPGKHDASIALAFVADEKEGRYADLKQVGNDVVVTDGDRVMAFIDTTNLGPLKAMVEPPGILRISGTFPSPASAQCAVYLPAWKTESVKAAELRSGQPAIRKLQSYWESVLGSTTQITLPDAFLTDVIRASQVHCLLAARCEAGGDRVAAWIGADRYGPLESESHAVIRGMDLLGHRDFARRSLEFFIHRYNDAGFLTTGYTIMGTGWHLWTLAEHVERTGDPEWAERVAPQIAKVCDWIVRQCEKTRKRDRSGEKVPEYGLVPPGVAADWDRYAYRFVQEAHYCAGLRDAARMLAAAGHDDADRFQAEAETFRDEILRAYRWTQARAPVLPLADGTWIPAYPGMLYCFGRIEDILPGEDWGRSWCYDVELGAHHLAALGILDPDDPEVTWMANHMEDDWFLHSGLGDYPEERNKADWFNLGGFSKVQPYYTRNAEIYAERDDVKPFIRSYFNTIPTLLNRETLSFWEHFHNLGAWDKPHETGYFLAQSRIMLVQERDDELWLAAFVTDNWLRDGMEIDVKDAPSRFGLVSFTVRSSIDDGLIEATIDPPKRRPAARIVLRLRHPEGRPIASVTVNGQSTEAFDNDRRIVMLEPSREMLEVRVRY